jgi:hypothetical protein
MVVTEVSDWCCQIQCHVPPTGWRLESFSHSAWFSALFSLPVEAWSPSVIGSNSVPCSPCRLKLVSSAATCVFVLPCPKAFSLVELQSLALVSLWPCGMFGSPGLLVLLLSDSCQLLSCVLLVAYCVCRCFVLLYRFSFDDGGDLGTSLRSLPTQSHQRKAILSSRVYPGLAFVTPRVYFSSRLNEWQSSCHVFKKNHTLLSNNYFQPELFLHCQTIQLRNEKRH